MSIALLLCTGATWGRERIDISQSDTLTVEEQQQFLYYFYEAQRLIEKEDIENAWELIQFCYNLNPNDATINHYMGLFCEFFDQHQQMIYHLQRAYELQPNEYWYQYAVCLLQTGNKSAENLAINNLIQVAKDNPKDKDVHTLLQKAFIHVKDYKNALLVQDKLDSIVGYNAESAMQRYKLNVAIDRPQQAIYEVERYLEEEPDDIQFQFFRLQLYEQTQQPSNKMIEAYKAIVPHQPRNWMVKNNLAWHLCISGGDLVLAEELSRATIMAEPSNPVFLDTYAWILYHLGKYQHALFYIQRALDNVNENTKKEVIKHYKAIKSQL